MLDQSSPRLLCVLASTGLKARELREKRLEDVLMSLGQTERVLLLCRQAGTRAAER